MNIYSLNLKNRMWFSVVCTLSDNDMRRHSGQNVVDLQSAAESTTNFDDHYDDAYGCRYIQRLTAIDLLFSTISTSKKTFFENETKSHTNLLICQ